MMRVFDFSAALVASIFTFPIVISAAFVIWLQDFRNPFYISDRIGMNGEIFQLFKLRSMIVGADKSEVDTTVSGDLRVTKFGWFVRNYKIDEFPQFWNVLIGDMSLVGPRPNVGREVKLYTNEEKAMLSVRPGITDIASIVFFDLANILGEASDPNIAYNQLVRPWKSRLTLFYINNGNSLTDFLVLGLTFMSFFMRQRVLKWVSLLLRYMGAHDELINISLRKLPLEATPPPGSNCIVSSR